MGDVTAAADKKEAVPVAPSDGKQPISLLSDRFCEELFHPHLFFNEQFVYKFKCMKIL